MSDNTSSSYIMLLSSLLSWLFQYN
jgi:hypothetical protein